MVGPPVYEFKSHYSGSKDPYPEKRLRELFEKYDTNGDRKLSKTELRAAFNELGSRVPAFRAWRGMADADANGDGAIDLDSKELDDLIKYAMEHDF